MISDEIKLMRAWQRIVMAAITLAAVIGMHVVGFGPITSVAVPLCVLFVVVITR